ncbi:MAG: zf-HC2 domain-containing protein [Ignavibacteriales bacterium]|nr:zf-HC2 domain-containing protein [Ignavibacteriales bacterium]
MTCEQYQMQIAQLFDNELRGEESSTVFAHLGACSECRDFFQASLQVRAELMNAETITAPDELDDRMRGAGLIPTEQTFSRKTSIWDLRIVFPLPTAASIALLLIIGSLFVAPALFHDSQPRQEFPPDVLQLVPVELRTPRP